MKVRCLLLLLLPALAASAETYNIDAGRSQIAFTIHQFVSSVRGDFHRFNGTIEVDREHPERSSVIVRISVGSIDTKIKKRDQHLLSSEFFDAGKFPEIIFKSRSVKQTGENSGDILGDFTMSDLARAIELPVEFDFMISTFGCNNGLILAGARVYYAMARDSLFFRKVGTTNRFHVPAFALIVQAIWTALLTLPRTVTTSPQSGGRTFGNVYTQLLEYIVSADLVFYVLLVAAVMVLRSKIPGAERPYRTWGYPLVPILSIALAALLILDLAFLAPSTSGIGILIVSTGVPVYFLWRRSA